MDLAEHLESQHKLLLMTGDMIRGIEDRLAVQQMTITIALGLVVGELEQAAPDFRDRMRESLNRTAEAVSDNAFAIEAINSIMGMIG